MIDKQLITYDSEMNFINMTGGLTMSFNDGLHKDQQHKQSVINSVVTVTNIEAYNSIVELALDDFSGIAEAYKVNAIDSQQDMREEFKTFLEEYTVNMINMINKK